MQLNFCATASFIVYDACSRHGPLSGARYQQLTSDDLSKYCQIYYGERAGSQCKGASGEYITQITMGTAIANAQH